MQELLTGKIQLMDHDHGRSEQAASKASRQSDGVDGTARWRESFIEHAGTTASNRLVLWVVVGVVVVIVLTFVLAATA